MNKMSKKFKVPMKFINYILNSPFKCSYFKNECEKAPVPANKSIILIFIIILLLYMFNIINIKYKSIFFNFL